MTYLWQERSHSEILQALQRLPVLLRQRLIGIASRHHCLQASCSVVSYAKLMDCLLGDVYTVDTKDNQRVPA